MNVLRSLLLAVCLGLSQVSFAQTANLQEQADRAFAEKSYARALQLYRAAKADKSAREPEKVDFQIVTSLFKTQKWDEAISSANFALKSASWKARFHYLLGQIYVKAPKSGYQLGDRVWRQNEYPEVAGDEKPTPVYLGESDQKLALQHLETAKVEAQRERDLATRGRFAVPIYPLTPDEEIDLNFDLAAFLPQSQFDEFIAQLEKNPELAWQKPLDATENYNREWILPRKVLALYAEIRALDLSDDKSDSARSLLAEGLFVRAYEGRMEGWATRYDAAQKKQITREFPFPSLDALAVWNQLSTKYPRSPLAPQAMLLVAQTLESDGDLIKAATAYRALVTKYPTAKWVSDARLALRRIEAREVSFSLLEPTRPGQNPKLYVQTRNLKAVEFAAYRVKLEDFLLDPKRLTDANTDFTSWEKNFGSIQDASRKFGAPVAKWKLAANDKGNHQAQNAEMSAPIREIGAYAVVASSTNKRFAQIVIISDLALLKKTDKDGSFVYLANAQSGAAVSGANVVLKESWNWSPRRVDVARGKSDDAGFFDKKRAGDSNGNQVAAFAYVGSRYALTSAQHNYWNDYGNRQNTRVFGTTDRPVYRPGQKVNFRQVITSRKAGGDWQPLVGQSYIVAAVNPKNETIWQKTLSTSEFGSLNDSFSLPADVPLGEFSLAIWRTKQGDNEPVRAEQIGTTQFRVEEYKRPEFEVTVSAPTEAKQPGETIAARINAKYYFGAPVPNAKVKYTVRKSTWWASYRFPSRYDWLYANWGTGEGDYATGRRNIGGEGAGEIVKEGEVQTDAQGFAELSFETAKSAVDESNWWARYSNPLYTIEAEVTDASRRVIEAQGQVKIARQPYFAFLDVKRGYFQKGDRVPIEIRAQDANNQSVAASGTVSVYKLLPGDKEEKIREFPISTDAAGMGTAQWEASDSGQFRLEYVGRGAWGEPVKAQTEVWVVGDQIGVIRLRGATILLDKKSYEEGETLKARIVVDKPGAHVLLTQEASGDILRRDVFFVEGQSREISIPIEKKHVPNFFLAAALVQDFEVYQAQTEVFVPPTRQMLDLKVTGDKPFYKPGETGTFQIQARDYSGKPARAEVSLALVDASLFYIQKSYAPEIRGFFYGERRANSVSLDSQRSGNVQAHAENDEKELPLEEHGFVLPDEFGQLQITPGEFGYGGYRRRRMNMRGDVLHHTGYASYLADDRLTSFEARAVPAPMASMDSAAKTGAGASSTNAPIAVRSNFAETASWSPAIVTNGGSATLKVTFPDSLTQWHATSHALTPTVQVGSAETDVATKKDLLVRLQAPRFFVEKDQVVISANVHNYSDKADKISVSLDLVGPIAGTSTVKTNAPDSQSHRLIELAAGEEKRVDFSIKVTGNGQAAIQATARSASHGLGFPQKQFDLEDSVKMTFPVLVHGVQRFASQSGMLRGNARTVATINLPKERKLGASNLNVQLNPSLAAQMLDALPYLADYPYGCVEQTMSRFLPSVLTEKTLRESGVNLQTLRARAKAYEAESKTAATGTRVANTGYTYPTGQPNARDLTEMASRLGRIGRSNNPIYDANEIRRMTQEGLNRLYSMQRADGGWGWWPGSEQSDEYMSAYVVYGLTQAKSANVAVRDEVLNRGRNYLKAQMKDEENLQLLTYIAYSLSELNASSTKPLNEDWTNIVKGRLFEQRERLAPLSKSYLALALFNVGQKDKAAVLVRNLENTAFVDEANGTARYKTNREYWYWWNNDVETVALALRAFVRIDPSNKLTPMLMKWLTLQARGNHYRSTKETAEVVYTLADYVSKFKELDVDYTLKVNLNGKLARTYRVTKDNALWFDNRFITGDLFLENGENKLTIEKVGKGNLYWSAASEYFSLEVPIKASGNELEVSRKFYKLTRQDNSLKMGRRAITLGELYDSNSSPSDLLPFPQPIQPKQEYTRAEIKDQTSVQSGDLIEVELVVNAKNDYEYLIFEDMKAAGFEPVELRSGSSYSDGLSSNVELRDEKVAFFVDKLPQGRRVLRYRVRAEAPGTFHALPTNGYAMYAPEVRAISDEIRVSIKD